MKPKERIETALRRGMPDRIPTFEWFVDPAVGEAMTGSRDILEIADALDLDAVNVRPDYRKDALDGTTFRDEWGCVRRETGDVLPAVVGHPIREIADHRDFRFPDPEAGARFATLERAMSRLGDDRAIILNLRDGFSDMRDLLGYENALVAMVSEPDDFRAFLERVVEYNIALARIARRRCGTAIVATTDDVAYPSGLLVSPEVYHDVLGPGFRRAIAGFKSEGYLCIKHSDGDVSALIDFWIECGIDCLDPIDPKGGMELVEIKRRFGNRICLKGNVDCSGVLCSGTPAEVEAAVRDCIAAGGPRGGYILSSSNTIHRGVDPDNYRAMLHAMRRHGSYPLAPGGDGQITRF